MGGSYRFYNSNRLEMKKDLIHLAMSAYLRISCREFGVGIKEVKEHSYRNENVKLARGAFLYLCKRNGYKHTEACDFIGLNYGNGTTFRKLFEGFTTKSRKAQLSSKARVEFLDLVRTSVSD